MKARILVIEDEMSINDLLCMNLEIAGYETVGYLDGNEAYEAIIQDHAFQCALVDIMLPGRDGYSLLPKLKQYEIPVIFLTDYSGTLRATCPDFESHHSGEWEPYIPVIQSHLIGLYYIYFLYTVNTHLWCEYR